MDNQHAADIESTQVNETTTLTDSDFPWVLFSIAGVIYGVFSAHVLSIEIMNETTPLVNSQNYLRGISDFRGEMISLIDLRTLFNLPNRHSELSEQLTPSINAHSTWVEKLEECVRDGKHFPLAIDPHNCAFGKWFYKFKTSNSLLDMLLKKIEGPHAHLHQTGGRIVKLMDEKNFEEIERLMAEEIRPTYNETMRLLEGIMPAYIEGTRDMVVVLEVDGIIKGIIVDEIVSVEYISKILEMGEISEKTQYVRNLGKREKDNSTVQLINEEKIIQL